MDDFGLREEHLLYRPPVADFFRRVLICLWHKTSPLGQIATATNSLMKCGGKQVLKRSF